MPLRLMLVRGLEKVRTMRGEVAEWLKAHAC